MSSSGAAVLNVEQLRRRHHSLSELTYARDEDAKLETTRARLSNILKRHEDLKDRLSRYSFNLARTSHRCRPAYYLR
uniref:Uncharacterized protein n=1 Tax=Setaria italica TaxID=4555 RepID=K3YKK9_SETIT